MASIHTKKITSAYNQTITTADGVAAISIQAATAGGSVNVIGNLPFGGSAPSTITLSDGEGITLTSPNFATPISGLTITWVSGTVNLLITTL
jgi:hypothetical protein